MLSEKHYPQGFKVEIGSTVQVVTIAAIETAKTRKKYKDYDDYKDSKDYKDLEKYKEKLEKDSKESKDYKDHKDHKEISDSEGIFTGVVLDETDLKLWRDYGKESASQEGWPKHKKHPIQVEEEDRYLILALTKPSFPFAAGQIVWLQTDQIVALSVIGHKPC